MSETAPSAIVTGGARGIGRGCALELATRATTSRWSTCSSPR